MTPEDRHAIEQLKAIRTIALMLYPYPDDSRTDPKLLLTLGEIAGIAGREINRMNAKADADAIIREMDKARAERDAMEAKRP